MGPVDWQFLYDSLHFLHDSLMWHSGRSLKYFVKGNLIMKKMSIMKTKFKSDVRLT